MGRYMGCHFLFLGKGNEVLKLILEAPDGRWSVFVMRGVPLG